MRIGSSDSPSTSQKVIGLCTWQRGFCHGTFNAGLTQTAACAFPTYNLRFYADQSHVPYLADVLKGTRPNIENQLKIIGYDLGIPRTALGSFRRFKMLLHQVLSMRHRDVACWIFADMGQSSLWMLRILLRLARVTKPVLVIAHGLFEPLGWDPAADVNRLPGLQGPAASNLRLVVLGDHIVEALRQTKLHPRHDIRSLPIAALEFAESDSSRPVHPRFVFPGVPDKGLTEFASIARAVRLTHPEATFTAAGFAPSTEDPETFSSLEDVSWHPLSFGEYVQRLNSASWGIWFSMHQPDPYRFRASSTIPDLIACGKPTIFKRNSMVDTYFNRFGSLGYACDSMPELLECARRVASGVNTHELQAHADNVAKARAALHPSSLAASLRDIVLTAGGSY